MKIINKIKKWWKKHFGPTDKYGFCRWGHDYGDHEDITEFRGTGTYIGEVEITKKVRSYKYKCKKCGWTNWYNCLY